jgi:hypothetical protein
MSATDVKKDLAIIQTGILAIADAAKQPKQAKEKGEKGPDFHAMRAKQEAVMDEHMPAMIEAGIHLVGGLFVNLQRIADALEDQHGAG